MKKIKIIILFCTSILLILLITLFIIKFYYIKEKNLIIESSNNSTFKENSIKFEAIKYSSIGDVIFYENDLELEDSLKENFNIMAKELKKKYPGKSILYLRNLGSASMFDAKELYRCMQISNGQKIDHSEMNVLIYEDDTVDFSLLIGQSWKNGSTDNAKITQEEAKQITMDYIKENPKDYNQMGVWGNIVCKCGLYYYNSKICWKMEFSIGNSYIIIDGDNGEILDKYFFSGIIVN